MIQFSQADLTRVFHALGDPTRMAILKELSRGETTAGELARPHKITLTMTLKHLRILEDAGLAKSIKVGRERRCQILTEPLRDIERWVEETRRGWNFRLDRLEEFLQETGDSR